MTTSSRPYHTPDQCHSTLACNKLGLHDVARALEVPDATARHSEATASAARLGGLANRDTGEPNRATGGSRLQDGVTFTPLRMKQHTSLDKDRL